jgi:hypothetical protein
MLSYLQSYSNCSEMKSSSLSNDERGWKCYSYCFLLVGSEWMSCVGQGRRIQEEDNDANEKAFNK